MTQSDEKPSWYIEPRSKQSHGTPRSSSVAVPKERSTKSIARRIRRSLTLAGLVLIAAALLDHRYADNHHWMAYVGMALIVVLFILWTWSLSWRTGGAWAGEINAARRRVPSPAEIAASLENEWARPATVEEVAAVHQMLTNRKSEALVNAGIGLGALYLMDKHFHGK